MTGLLRILGWILLGFLGWLAMGEFVLDPDYPMRRTVIGWCRAAGFELVGEYGSFLHYVLVFKLE